MQRLKRDASSPGAVRVSAAEGQGTRRRRQYLTVLAALLVLAAAVGGWFVLRSGAPRNIDSVAVLPFVNANADPDTDYLSDGITEDVINALSENRRLRVMTRSTVFHYKGKDQDPTQIGASLNVAAVLTGRLAQRGDQVQIDAELVNVRDGAAIWGKAVEESRSIAVLFGQLPGVNRDSSDFLRRSYIAGGAKGYWHARLDLAKKASRKEWGFPSSWAMIYAHLGQMDAAFEWLAKGVDQYDQEATWMNGNPSFDIMRSDPRFAALVRKMGQEPMPLPKSQ